MDFGVMALNHGVSSRDERGDITQHRTAARDMRPIEFSVRAEELGFHSVWLPDHVVTEQNTVDDHPANLSGKRAYPESPDLLDTATTMGAIAGRTSTLVLATGVYIAPYRHPLITAHQFATLDVLSEGRTLLGIGVGWMSSEFAALGVDYAARGDLTEECIEVYRMAWSEPIIDFHGRFYDITGVSMDPKPVQKPLPIWWGGTTRVGARRAARTCDGFYQIFLDAVPERRPEATTYLREEILREAERIGRDLGDFQMAGFPTGRVYDRAEDVQTYAGERPLLTGTVEQILEDVAHFADHGFGHLTIALQTSSGEASESFEQLERFGTEVLPLARDIKHRALVA